jgi:hypothetical protein
MSGPNLAEPKHAHPTSENKRKAVEVLAAVLGKKESEVSLSKYPEFNADSHLKTKH